MGREVDLRPTEEEELDDLKLGLLQLMRKDSKTQGSAMSENNAPTLKMNSKH